VSDTYFDHSIGPTGTDGEVVPSPDTLAATKDSGERVVESAPVVDHTEPPVDGLVAATVGPDSSPLDHLVAQIWSLEARAASRDNEAIDSAELRQQAHHLKSRHTKLVANDMACRIDTKEFMQFGAGLPTE
jgi:hypothetical protein